MALVLALVLVLVLLPVTMVPMRVLKTKVRGKADKRMDLERNLHVHQCRPH